MLRGIQQPTTIRTILSSILLGFLLSWPAPAAVLQSVRVGITEQKTRLVFELDRATPYQVNFGATGVEITFTTLEVSESSLKGIEDSLGGLATSLDHETKGNQTRFKLAVPAPYYGRYFDLTQPTRVVLDLYPKEEKAQAVKKAPPPPPVAKLSRAESAAASPPPTVAQPSTTPEAAAINSESKVGKEVSPAPQPSATTPDSQPTVKVSDQTKVTAPSIPAPDRGLNHLALALVGSLVLLVFIIYYSQRRAAHERRGKLKRAQTPLIHAKSGSAFQSILKEHDELLGRLDRETEASAETAIPVESHEREPANGKTGEVESETTLTAKPSPEELEKKLLVEVNDFFKEVSAEEEPEAEATLPEIAVKDDLKVKESAPPADIISESDTEESPAVKVAPEDQPKPSVIEENKRQEEMVPPEVVIPATETVEEKPKEELIESEAESPAATPEPVQPDAESITEPPSELEVPQTDLTEVKAELPAPQDRPPLEEELPFVIETIIKPPEVLPRNVELPLVESEELAMTPIEEETLDLLETHPEAETIPAEVTTTEPDLSEPLALESVVEETTPEISVMVEEAAADLQISTLFEEVQPELRAEDGTLTWTVHLLDGGRKGRILVVDDEGEIVAVLDEYLKREGYEVQGLTDSQAALEKYWKWHPDLVMLDVVMPELSGVDWANEIRGDEERHKLIFMSGKSERQGVQAAFPQELQNGLYEFFRKPLSLEQIGGRIRDYFSSARSTLHLNLLDRESFSASLEPLTPHQLVALHSFVFDRIFETSVGLLGRRIEPYYITDRMEPPDHYMRKMGCQRRRDYCIAVKCIVSNPECASLRLRAELEVMRQILQEFREEYVARVSRGIGQEDLASPKKRKSRKKKA